jgi:hypothetical protein
VPPLLLLGPLFYNYSLLAHHLVNWDDQHLLAPGNGLWLLSRTTVFTSRTICVFCCYGSCSMPICEHFFSWNNSVKEHNTALDLRQCISYVCKLQLFKTNSNLRLVSHL